MAFKPIEIIINAKDNASAVFGRLQTMIVTVGAALLSYFGVTAFAGAVKGAADFEEAMSRVKAATDGTAEEMAALRKAAEDAGANTKYTSVEAAAALENLAKAGLSANDAIAALPAVLSLAQAGDLALGQSAEFVTKAVMGMGLSFQDAGRVADVLAKGANATNTSVEGLAQALSYAAPVANTLGLSLESTVAIIGKFADAGIDASRAGTALNSILSQFANPASQFRKELGAAGIVTTDFEKALHQLAAKGPEGARAINAVGLEAGPALRALLNQGMGALDDLTGKLREAEGSAAATAKTMSDNLNGSIKGLSSVWDSLTTALATPVLPVLKQAFDELAMSLRGIVADGTVTRFGESIATAFKNGIDYVRQFLQTIDFQAVGVKLQSFADETNAAFTKIGEYATNAGNTLQTVWGVMTAGTNAVLTVIYGLGSVFAEVASSIMTGVSKLRQGLATVTFGKLSESFKLAADDAVLAAEGFSDAAQAMRDKAAEALQDTADAAQTARAGFAGLIGASKEAGAAASQSSLNFREVAAAIEETGRKSAEAKKASLDKAAADTAAAESVKRLRAEYSELMASGNLQAAAEKLREIDKAQRGVADSAKLAAEATALIDQAYADLGLTTGTELKRLADQGRAAFSQLEKDGTQSALRMADAFKVMAERAIAANGGIVPAWLKLEASAKGYTIALDDAGKAVVNTDKATRSATGSMIDSLDRVGNATRRVSGYVRDLGSDFGFTADAAIKLAQAGQHLAAVQAQKNQDTADSSITKTQGQTNAISNLVPAFETVEELRTWNEEWKRQYAEMNPFSVKSSGALGNYQYDLTQFAVSEAEKAIKLKQASATGKASSPQASGTTATTRTINLNINGRALGSVNTDAAGEAALERLLDELERSKALAGQ
ncbi:phage tail tape measure protein [Delftia tsuruhatensis]|uniref:phage tail tape measure protein n=1 Tax=Delftia tsuruhatensis TaxID=180282 RepID=UPI002090AB50|nr:phage tail tape measure protein [Delftia tsuruhatensis]MCO5338255.1 phage tail tape measure protein [Delftia tsuruhatensis]MCR4545653.1 phage tail tape measure protein [Delftia tsuruhatensis]